MNEERIIIKSEKQVGRSASAMSIGYYFLREFNENRKTKI